jgi:hypothetical protein
VTSVGNLSKVCHAGRSFIGVWQRLAIPVAAAADRWLQIQLRRLMAEFDLYLSSSLAYASRSNGLS